jgi:hypothetical protein
MAGNMPQVAEPRWHHAGVSLFGISRHGLSWIVHVCGRGIGIQDSNSLLLNPGIRLTGT